MSCAALHVVVPRNHYLKSNIPNALQILLCVDQIEMAFTFANFVFPMRVLLYLLNS